MEHAMKIIQPKLLAAYRLPGPCEYCRKPCKRREPAHLLSRGAGGSDLDCNLVALGSTLHWACPCHTNSHAGKSPTTAELLAVVAARERVAADTIMDVLYFVRRLDKGLSAERIEEALKEPEGAAVVLARKELIQAGVIA